jgi:hypothetical protein
MKSTATPMCAAQEMNSVRVPDKEKVRAWLLRRHAERESPPDVAQIQRELGWKTQETTNREL